MSKPLTGQIALITGGSGGIGQAACATLAEQGCNIAVHYNMNKDAATKVAETCKESGVQAEMFSADLSQYEEVRSLYNSVVEKMGQPTILFNNAGTTLGKFGLPSISDISVDEFEATWRSNCGSAFMLTQLCIPAMEKQGWGRVVFCSSVAAFNGGIVGPHYASSKSALHGLIHWLAGAYSKKGITVNGIAPALIEDTTMLPGGNEELAKRVPLGRLGKPQEIADTLLWIIKTGYVTNKVVPVDGGFLAY